MAAKASWKYAEKKPLNGHIPSLEEAVRANGTRSQNAIELLWLDRSGVFSKVL